MSNTKHRSKCPNCGGFSSFDGAVGYCEYCGVPIQRENSFEYTYTYVKRDEARIKETERKEKAQQREYEYKKEMERLIYSQNIRKIIAIVVAIILSIITLAIIINVAQEKEEKRIRDAIADGKITAGYYDDYIGENYKSVVKQFKAMGFTNIKTVDAGTAGLMFWKNGKVKRITINGKDNFDEKDYFDKDAKVIITYH